MEAVAISVQNLSSVLSDEEAKAIVAALQAQTSDYNDSAWVTSQNCSPIASVTLMAQDDPIPTHTWHMELLDTSDQPGALGYHDEEKGAFRYRPPGGAGRLGKAKKHSSRWWRKGTELPWMKIFAKTTLDDGGQPSEVASHELLEAAVDPRPGAAPKIVTDAARNRLVIVEVGDPVQDCGYDRAGRTVADFALPAWFGYEDGNQMSFRSSVEEAFELAPGGYISFAPEDEPQAWQQEFGSRH
jgi:hypothetical protein